MQNPVENQELDLLRGRGQFPLRHAVRFALANTLGNRRSTYHVLAWASGSALVWTFINGTKLWIPTVLFCCLVAFAIGFLSPIIWRWRLVPRGTGRTAMLLVNSAVGFLVGYLVFFTTMHATYGFWIGGAIFSPQFLRSAAAVSLNGFTFAIIGFYIVVGHDQHRREGRLARQRRRLERLAEEAHQVALRAQINPHFFFNALNTIAALIPARPADAERAVELLAEALRPVLTREQPPTATLERELHVARAYGEIEQLRFGDRVRLVFLIDEEYFGVALPSLSLQPLLENAFRHGAANTAAPFAIEVRAIREGECLRLRLSSHPADNPNPRLTREAVIRPGHALHNIAARLRALGGGRAGLSVRLSEDGISACAEMTVPFSAGAPRAVEASR